MTVVVVVGWRKVKREMKSSVSMVIEMMSFFFWVNLEGGELVFFCWDDAL